MQHAEGGTNVATRVHLEVVLPSAVSHRLKAEAAREGRRQLMLALFKKGACAAGVAAKGLGMRLAEFMEFAKEEGLFYVDDARANGVSSRRVLHAMKARSGRRLPSR